MSCFTSNPHQRGAYGVSSQNVHILLLRENHSVRSLRIRSPAHGYFHLERQPHTRRLEMRNHRVTLLTLLTMFLLLALPMTASSQSIEVDPLSWDFGDVVVGETATKEFTVACIAQDTLMITLVALTAEEDFSVPYLEHDFEITGGPDLHYDASIDHITAGPTFIDNGSSVNWEVTYSPTSIGLHNAELFILSNDYDPPEDSQIYVHLTGNGVDSGITPVPEPATMLLLGTGLIGLAGFRRKFKKG
jgi:hypothetical protein